MVDFLGIDIKTLEDGDIQFTFNDDLGTIDGLDNLSQAIRNRLRTELGELSAHTAYGSRIPALIGEGNTTTVLQELRQTIRETLLQEPRIDSIDRIRVRRKALDQVQIEIIVTPITGQSPLNIVFPLFL